jgi:hypothetical protein
MALRWTRSTSSAASTPDAAGCSPPSPRTSGASHRHVHRSHGQPVPGVARGPGGKDRNIYFSSAKLPATSKKAERTDIQRLVAARRHRPARGRGHQAEQERALKLLKSPPEPAPADLHRLLRRRLPGLLEAEVRADPIDCDLEQGGGREAVQPPDRDPAGGRQRPQHQTASCGCRARSTGRTRSS